MWRESGSPVLHLKFDLCLESSRSRLARTEWWWVSAGVWWWSWSESHSLSWSVPTAILTMASTSSSSILSEWRSISVDIPGLLEASRGYDTPSGNPHPARGASDPGDDHNDLTPHVSISTYCDPNNVRDQKADFPADGAEWWWSLRGRWILRHWKWTSQVWRRVQLQTLWQSRTDDSSRRHAILVLVWRLRQGEDDWQYYRIRYWGHKK